MPSTKPRFRSHLEQCLNGGLFQKLLFWLNSDVFAVNMNRINSSGWKVENAQHFLHWDGMNYDAGILKRKPQCNKNYVSVSRHRYKTALKRLVDLGELQRVKTMDQNHLHAYRFLMKGTTQWSSKQSPIGSPEIYQNNNVDLGSDQCVPVPGQCQYLHVVIPMENGTQVSLTQENNSYHVTMHGAKNLDSGVNNIKLSPDVWEPMKTEFKTEEVSTCERNCHDVFYVDNDLKMQAVPVSTSSSCSDALQTTSDCQQKMFLERNSVAIQIPDDPNMVGLKSPTDEHQNDSTVQQTPDLFVTVEKPTSAENEQFINNVVYELHIEDEDCPSDSYEVNVEEKYKNNRENVLQSPKHIPIEEKPVTNPSGIKSFNDMQHANKNNNNIKNGNVMISGYVDDIADTWLDTFGKLNANLGQDTFFGAGDVQGEKDCQKDLHKCVNYDDELMDFENTDVLYEHHQESTIDDNVEWFKYLDDFLQIS